MDVRSYSRVPTSCDMFHGAYPSDCERCIEGERLRPPNGDDSEAVGRSYGARGEESMRGSWVKLVPLVSGIFVGFTACGAEDRQFGTGSASGTDAGGSSDEAGPSKGGAAT